MYTLFLSWRFLFARRTNLIGIVGILVGVGALILILSIMTGFLEESRRTVRGTLSDLILQPYQGEQMADGVPVPTEAGKLLAAVRSDPRVQGASSQLLWGGIITQQGREDQISRLMADQSGGGLLAVQLVGIDVHGPWRLAQPLLAACATLSGGFAPRLAFEDELSGGSFFLESLLGPPDERDASRRWTTAPTFPLFPFVAPKGTRLRGTPKAGVLIGEQLFFNLRLRAGDIVQLATATFDPTSGEPQVSNRDFVVAGTFRTRENETDLGRIYLPRAELADFLGGSRTYTQVLVRLKDYDGQGAEVRDDFRSSLAQSGLILGAEFADIEVRTWEEFRGSLLGAIENERVLMAIMLSLVLVVAGFTVFAILSMMVTEKRRDIGILSSLGATPKGVLWLFLMIAFWDALIGATLGAVLGTWGAFRIDDIERWLSRTMGIEIFNRNVYLFDHIPSVVIPYAVALIVMGAFLCTLVFAAFPAIRAARLDPLRALRYE